MPRLIIIRGNSGSGKTTIAKKLQEDLQPHFAKAAGTGVMLVSQDVIRREILRVRDVPDNPSIQMIKNSATYGSSLGFDVIIEGILLQKIYGKMLLELIGIFDETHTYYFNVSLEETLHRHKSKPNSHEFGEAEMRDWYVAHDVLNLPNEKLFTDRHSEDEILQSILSDVR